MTPDLKTACRIAGIAERDATDPSRDMSLVRRRWHVMALLRANGATHVQIGRLLNRDHTTVIHGLRRWAELQNAKLRASTR